MSLPLLILGIVCLIMVPATAGMLSIFLLIIGVGLVFFAGLDSYLALKAMKLEEQEESQAQKNRKY